MDELTEIAKQLSFVEHGASRLALLKRAYEIADKGNSGEKRFRMKLPTDFLFYQETGQYDVPELAAYYNQNAVSIMQKLDQRNGNSYFSDIYRTVVGAQTHC